METRKNCVLEVDKKTGQLIASCMSGKAKRTDCTCCKEMSREDYELMQQENFRRESEKNKERERERDDDEPECTPVETERQMLERMIYGLECQAAVMDGRNQELAGKIKRFQLPAGRCKSAPGAPCGTGGWHTYPIDIENVLACYAQTVQRLTNQIERLGKVVEQLDAQMRAAGIKRMRCHKECTYECAATQCPPLGDCICEKLAWEIIDTVKELNVLMENCNLDKKMKDLKSLTKDLQTVK